MLVLQIVAIAVVVGARSCSALMGRDYEAAVMSGGFCGFMLGTTANAMANMEALVAALRPGAEGVPRRADGRRVLRRLHERAHHHGCLNIWR